MKTQKAIEYDVRTIDEYGDVADLDSFYSDGAHSKRRAIESAQQIVRNGGTAVVERVTYTMDKDKDEFDARKVVDVEYEKIWTGGDHDRLIAGGWRTEDSEGGAA